VRHLAGLRVRQVWKFPLPPELDGQRVLVFEVASPAFVPLLIHVGEPVDQPSADPLVPYVVHLERKCLPPPLSGSQHALGQRFGLVVRCRDLRAVIDRSHRLRDLLERSVLPPSVNAVCRSESVPPYPELKFNWRVSLRAIFFEFLYRCIFPSFGICPVRVDLAVTGKVRCHYFSSVSHCGTVSHNENLSRIWPGQTLFSLFSFAFLSPRTFRYGREKRKKKRNQPLM